MSALKSLVLGQHIEVQRRDLFYKRIHRPLNFPGINGLDVLSALITHIHPILLFFFAKEIVRCFLILIFAERTIYPLAMPLVGTKAAKEEPLSFTAEYGYGWRTAANRTIPFFP